MRGERARMGEDCATARLTFLWHLLLQKRTDLASLRTNVMPLLG